MYCTYYIVLYFTVLYCTILYCTKIGFKLAVIWSVAVDVALAIAGAELSHLNPFCKTSNLAI